jgi:hypothetical protein
MFIDEIEGRPLTYRDMTWPCRFSFALADNYLRFIPLVGDIVFALIKPSWRNAHL